jgi:hypothetical protein
MISVEQRVASQSVPSPACADLLTEAERELTAYLTAVKEVHGLHSVNNAIEHWMQALDQISMSGLASKESFRKVTFSAVSALCL